MTKTLKEIQEKNRKAIIMACHPKAKTYDEALEMERHWVDCYYLYSLRCSYSGDWVESIKRGVATLYGYKEGDYYLKVIIGKPLTLNRALKAIESHSNNFGFIANHIARIHRKDKTYDLLCGWDLEKETLEEQSEEVQRKFFELWVKKLKKTI